MHRSRIVLKLECVDLGCLGVSMGVNVSKSWSEGVALECEGVSVYRSFNAWMLKRVCSVCKFWCVGVAVPGSSSVWELHSVGVAVCGRQNV